jgi:cytohesin
MKQILITIAAVVLVGCGPSVPDISIHDAAAKGNIEAVKQHIAAGTDVNVKREYGFTPFHYAAYEGHKKIVELLIGKGADVNAKIDDGRTPLHFAAPEGHKEIAELLIAKGANVNAKDDYGRTPLDIATHPLNQNETAETANLLRKHGGKTGEELKAEGK